MRQRDRPSARVEQGGERVPPQAPAASAEAAVQRLIPLQQTAGNAAVSRLISRTGRLLSRQNDPPGTATAPATAPAATAPTLDSEITAVVDEIVAGAAPLVGTANARDIWPIIVGQVNDSTPSATVPARLRAGPLATFGGAVFSASVVRHLQEVARLAVAGRPAREHSRLKTQARIRILNALYDRLGPSAVAGAALAAPGAATDPAVEAAIELPLLSDRVRNNLGDGWPETRRGFLAKFGALEIGPQAAITRANAYFATLVQSSLCGVRGSLVHPNLQARLDAATNSLTAAEQATIRPNMGTPGGFNIRANRNNPAVLSFHSFGWAIDLRPSTNPNTPDSALELVETVTGTNPFNAAGQAGRARRNFTTGLTDAEAEAEAQRLFDASAAYVAAFADDAAVGNTALRHLNASRTAEGMAALSAADAAAIFTAARAANARAPAIAALMFPAAAGGGAGAAPVAPVAPDVRRRREAAAARLIAIFAVYRESQARGGGRVGASSQGSRGSVAAHGFFNLPPQLVGALVGSNAGGLVWLGSSSVHDYMHFELPPAMQPPLDGTAAPAAGAAGAAGAGAAGGAAAPVAPPVAAPAEEPAPAAADGASELDARVWVPPTTTMMAKPMEGSEQLERRLARAVRDRRERG